MAQTPAAIVFDTEGPELSACERDFFREVNPFGYILFARHCVSPEQVRKLVDDLKTIHGQERLPVFIDQEGGRVARLRPPHWQAYPPANVFSRLAGGAAHAARLNARLIAEDLRALGITVNCAPLADLPVAGAHDVIGDRAFGSTPQEVIPLARAMAQGLMEGGVVPVLKHLPGHGRAGADSHEELPVVRADLATLRETDFVPFKALADLPMAMTAHVLFTEIDPERMATVSPAAIRLIREEIGFKGLLLSDDISMKAMQGGLAGRVQQALTAGCDVALHCNAALAEKQEAACGAAPLTTQAQARAEAAMQSARSATAFDVAAARAELGKLLAA